MKSIETATQIINENFKPVMNQEQSVIVKQYKKEVYTIASAMKVNLMRRNSDKDTELFTNILNQAEHLIDKIKDADEVNFHDMSNLLRSALLKDPSPILLEALEDYFYGLRIVLFYKCRKQPYVWEYDITDHPCFKGIYNRKIFRDFYHSVLKLIDELAQYRISDQEDRIVQEKLLRCIESYEDVILNIDENIAIQWDKL